MLEPSIPGELGCFNSDFFKFFLERELAESNRYGYFSGYALFRMDEADDEAIKKLVRCLSSNVRNTDYVGLLDGQTVALILQHASVEATSSVLHRLEGEVSSVLPPRDGHAIRGSYAVFPTEANTQDALTSLAERRLG